MRRGGVAALVCMAALTAPELSGAQGRTTPSVFPELPSAGAERSSSLGPTLLSLALPGTGQHVLGQRRKWAYLALEVVAWTVYAERHASAGDYRDRYRDFAWESGRIRSGPRVDGDFEYYERLTKWQRSGVFDADPGRPGVQPELDPRTFNGSIWTLASQIFLPPGETIPETDPAHLSALAYYEQRAYGTELLWDWTGAPDGQRELARLIEASDDRFRQATTALGAVIANHLLSAGDAYLSSRGRVSPVRVRIEPDARMGVGWLTVVSVAIGP